WIKAVLDTVEAGNKHCRECEISIAGRIGRTKLDPFRARVWRIHRNPAAGGAVALRIDQVDRRLVARHQATIGVGGRSAKAAQGPSVSQQAANIKAAHFAEIGILRAVEEVGFPLPDALM